MHTVLSAFDDLGAAERAVDLLVAEGFPRENTHIEARGDQDRASDRVTSRTLESAEREIAVGPRAGSALDHFFDRLLGHKHPAHASTYSEAVRRGSAVVVVDTSSEVSAERAATVMQESGAYDIAERTQQWRRDGWSVVASGEQQLAGGGGVFRWKTAHVIHRPSEPLSEVLEQRSRFHA